MTDLVEFRSGRGQLVKLTLGRGHEILFAVDVEERTGDTQRHTVAVALRRPGRAKPPIAAILQSQPVLDVVRDPSGSIGTLASIGRARIAKAGLGRV
nr:hypothetical protein GCM10020063_041360 [Dactylosporangium thailandense]